MRMRLSILPASRCRDNSQKLPGKESTHPKGLFSSFLCHQPKLQTSESRHRKAKQERNPENPRSLSETPSDRMATDAILETIKPRRSPSREDLPVTHAVSASGKGKAGGGDLDLSGMRRRVSSSLSARIRPLTSSSSSSSTAAMFRRARSMPSVKALAAAGALRRWWEWGLGWVMARKPPFARGLEMSDDEARALGGCHCRGTLRHVFFRARAEVRRLLGRDGRPVSASAQDFRYDSASYAQNFDDGIADDAHARC